MFVHANSARMNVCAMSIGTDKHAVLHLEHQQCGSKHTARSCAPGAHVHVGEALSAPQLTLWMSSMSSSLSKSRRK